MKQADSSLALDWFNGRDRRAHRRHDLLDRDIVVERLDAAREKVKSARSGPKSADTAPATQPFGQLIDLSAGGIRLRTTDRSATIGSQIRVRIELPAFAGISPFIDHTGPTIRPKREWTGWLTVVRIRDLGNEREIGARLEDIDELDRGMLSLYLSTQPLAA
jgi:hypothetical protein